MDNAGELIDGKEALFQIALGRDLVRGDAVAVGDDAADVGLVHTLRLEKLPHMVAVLLGGGILLIVHVMKPADGLPVVPVLAEVIRHRAHGRADAGGVDKKMVLGGVLGKKLLGPFQR